MTTSSDLTALQAAAHKLAADIAALQSANIAALGPAAAQVAADSQALTSALQALSADFPPPSTSTTTSPDGTFLWPAQGGSLTDAAGETITLGAANMIMVNGQAAGRAVNFLKMFGGSAYGSDGANWFIVANGTATYANPDTDPDPSVPNTMPNTNPPPSGGTSGSTNGGTTSPPAANTALPGQGSLTSSTGHVYTLTAAKVLQIDGKAPSYASNAGQPLGGSVATYDELYLSGGCINFFTNGNWCVLYDDGTWAQCNPDQLGAPPQAGNPVPPATPANRTPPQGNPGSGDTAPAGASPDKTQVFSPTSNPSNALSNVTAITDAKAQLWSLGATAANGTAPSANYPVLINGSAPASAWAGVMLTCLGGNIYGVNAATEWFSFDVSGNPTAINSLPDCAPTSDLPTPTTDLTLIKSLIAKQQPNTFALIPNSALSSVLIDAAMSPPANGVPANVMAAWGGAAFDRINHIFDLWGGGHTDWGGNEHYGVSLSDCVWHRLTNSSPVVIVGDPSKEGSYQTTDGTPISSHSYGGNVWCSLTGETITINQAPYPSGVAGNSGLMDDVNAFNPYKKTWRHVLAGTALGAPNGEAYLSGDWSASKQRIIYQRSGTTISLDPVGNTATTGGGQMGDIGTSDSCLDDAAGKLYSFYNSLPNPGCAVSDTTSLVMADFFANGNIGPANDRAPNVAAFIQNTWGSDFDTKRGLITRWDGNKTVITIDPKTGAFAQYILATGSYIPQSQTPDGIFGRFRYLPEVDCFVGLSSITEGFVTFVPGTATPIVPQLNSVTVTTGTTSATTNTPGAATLNTSSTMAIAAGTFEGFSDAADGTTINGVPGTLPNGLTPVALPTALIGFAPGTGGLGCIVTTGSSTTVNNLSCSQSVSGENSSGIRHQGGALNVNACDFFGNDMNFLSAPTDASNSNQPINFIDTVFRDSAAGNELNHNCYISVSGAAGPSAVTGLRGGSYRANGEGHLFKSRALATTLTQFDLIMGGANSSRCLDVCDGGQMLVQYSRIQQGPDSDNADMMGFADEFPGNALNVDGPSALNVMSFATVTKLIGNYPFSVANNIITLVGAPPLPTGTQLIPATILNDGNFPAPLTAYTAYKWTSLSATTGMLSAINADGSTGAPLTLPNIAAGTFSLMYFQPDPQRTHSALVKNSILIFDKQTTLAGPVIVASNQLAKAWTLNGVTVGPVAFTVQDCLLINRSKNPLTFPDPTHMVQDGGGNTVIDGFADPASLAANGIQPYPWLPPLPVMPAAA